MHEPIVIDVSKSVPNRLGQQKFKDFPRVGEWIEHDDKTYEVVAVAHSSAGDGSDIFVKYLGIKSQLTMGLCNPPS
jgi:hypothetical protein